MTTQRQAREHERRRQAKLEAKIAQRQASRLRQRNRALIGAGLLIVIGAIGLTIWWFASRPEETWATSEFPPPASLAEARTWNSVISTNHGDIAVELDGVNAPQAVASFVALAGEGFFDGTSCHRLVTQGIYVLQCGDPTGSGSGGPSFRFGPIENAPADNIYPTGTLAMARVGGDGNSMGSQFFIVYDESEIPSDLAGGYTVFGTVTAGLDIVETVAQGGTLSGATDGSPALSVTINEVTAS